MALPSDGQPWNNPKVRVGDNPGVAPPITTRVFVRRYLSNHYRALELAARFSSSLDAPNGVNVALFDPTVVEYSNARIVVVTSTEIAYESIQPQRLAPGSKP